MKSLTINRKGMLEPKEFIAFSVMLVFVLGLAIVVVQYVFNVSTDIGYDLESNTTEVLTDTVTETQLSPMGDRGIESSSVTTPNQTWLNTINTTTFVNLTNIPFNYNSSTPFTITAWVRNNSAAARMAIVSRQGNSTVVPYYLHLRSDGRFALRTYTGSWNDLHSNADYVNGSDWNHVAVTYNKTNISIYVNGIFAAQYAGLISPNSVGGGEVYFAKQSSLSESLNGSIDDIRFYETSLYPSSINYIYSQRRSSDKLIPVLMYHKIGEPGDDSYNINETTLRQHLDYLQSEGFETITDIEYYNWTQGKFIMPSKPIILVWDDGDGTLINKSAPIMAEYGYKGVAALATSFIGTSSFMTWENVTKLINVYNWSIASHTDSHCHVGNRTGGTPLVYCNDSVTMTGNMSYSKVRIMQNASFEPITFIHPYNDWNLNTMFNCAKNYTLCFGFSYPAYEIRYLSLKSNFTNGELRRLEINNITTLSELNWGLNYSDYGNTGLFKLNENNGTIAYDASGNGNNGTISGATWQTDGQTRILESSDYSISDNGALRLLNSIYSYSLLTVVHSAYVNDENSSNRSSNTLLNLGGLLAIVGVIAFIYINVKDGWEF